MIRNLVLEIIENFKRFCELHRGKNKDQIKETEIRRKRNKKRKKQFYEKTDKKNISNGELN